MRCVEIVSLGKVALSTRRTLYPFLASSMAVGEPAHRAPTTMTSKLCLGIGASGADRLFEGPPQPMSLVYVPRAQADSRGTRNRVGLGVQVKVWLALSRTAPTPRTGAFVT